MSVTHHPLPAHRLTPSLALVIAALAMSGHHLTRHAFAQEANTLIQQIRAISDELQPLAINSTEKLVLTFSKSTDRFGQSRKVLVFLGRPRNQGWEAIGNGDVSQLQDHWGTVADRCFADILSLDLESQDVRKIELAIEFTIARFVRLYEGLQRDLAIDDPSRLRIEERYNELRSFGADGPFGVDSLAVRVARRILEQAKESSTTRTSSD